MKRSSTHNSGLSDAIRKVLAEELRDLQMSAVRVPTLAEYAETWLEQRRQLHLVSVDDDAARLRLHALPLLGPDYLLDVFRPRHLRKLIQRLRADGKLAPRTVRHVYAVLTNLFHCAVADELIAASPCVLRRGDLPPSVDRDPSWRATAIYSRAEIEALLSDSNVIPWRRMLYGLKFFAGLRHTEAATLTWSMIEKREPLDAILLAKTKARRPRSVPVHPTLSWLLSDWRHNGFPKMMGRQPRLNDYIVPARNGHERRCNNSQRALLEDLSRLGWRRRRGHDFRRAMITFLRADGARDEVLRVITHGPRQDVQESYTSWPWEVLCAEMLKLRIGVGRGIQQPLPFAEWVHARSSLSPAFQSAALPAELPGQDGATTTDSHLLTDDTGPNPTTSRRRRKA